MTENCIVVHCKCSVGGCPKTARWQIGFRINPAGTKSDINAVEGLTGVVVCDEHAIRNPDQFFTPKRKRWLLAGFLHEGKGMPDFATAQIIHNEIAGGEPISPGEAARLGGVPGVA